MAAPGPNAGDYLNFNTISQDIIAIVPHFKHFWARDSANKLKTIDEQQYAQCHQIIDDAVPPTLPPHINYHTPPLITSIHQYTTFLERVIADPTSIHPETFLRASAQYNYIHIRNVLNHTHPQIAFIPLYNTFEDESFQFPLLSPSFVSQTFASLATLITVSPQCCHITTKPHNNMETTHGLNLCRISINLKSVRRFLANIYAHYGLTGFDPDSILPTSNVNIELSENPKEYLSTFYSLFDAIQQDPELLHVLNYIYGPDAPEDAFNTFTGATTALLYTPLRALYYKTYNIDTLLGPFGLSAQKSAEKLVMQIENTFHAAISLYNRPFPDLLHTLLSPSENGSHSLAMFFLADGLLALPLGHTISPVPDSDPQHNFHAVAQIGKVLVSYLLARFAHYLDDYGIKSPAVDQNWRKVSPVLVLPTISHLFLKTQSFDPNILPKTGEISAQLKYAIQKLQSENKTCAFQNKPLMPQLTFSLRLLSLYLQSYCYNIHTASTYQSSSGTILNNINPKIQPPEGFLRTQLSYLYKFVDSHTLTADEGLIATAIMSNLASIVESATKGNFTLWPYGSIVSGLATKSSDLDLRLTKLDNGMLKVPLPQLPLLPADQVPRQTMRLILSRISHAINRDKNFTTAQRIFSARVPLLGIKYSNCEINKDIDLCFSDDQSQAKTQLFQTFLSINPVVYPLLVLVKHWAKQRCCLDASLGYLNSFSLSLMVFFFLQVKGILPVLHRGLEDMNHPERSYNFTNPHITINHTSPAQQPKLGTVYEFVTSGPYLPETIFTDEIDKPITFELDNLTSSPFNTLLHSAPTKMSAINHKEYRIDLSTLFSPDQKIIPVGSHSNSNSAKSSSPISPFNFCQTNTHIINHLTPFLPPHSILFFSNADELLSDPTPVISENIPQLIETNYHSTSNLSPLYSISWESPLLSPVSNYESRYNIYTTYCGPSKTDEFLQYANYNDKKLHSGSPYDLKCRYSLYDVPELRKKYPHLFTVYSDDPQPLLEHDHMSVYNKITAIDAQLTSRSAFANSSLMHMRRQEIFRVPIQNLYTLPEDVFIGDTPISPHDQISFNVWSDVYQLLREFFFFYAYVFNPKIHVISVRTGHFTWLHEYFHYNTKHCFIKNSRMNIFVEDPFSPFDNTVRSVDPCFAEMILFEMKRTAILFAQNAPIHIIFGNVTSELLALGLLLNHCSSEKGPSTSNFWPHFRSIVGLTSPWQHLYSQNFFYSSLKPLLSAYNSAKDERNGYQSETCSSTVEELSNFNKNDVTDDIDTTILTHILSNYQTMYLAASQTPRHVKLDKLDELLAHFYDFRKTTLLAHKFALEFNKLSLPFHADLKKKAIATSRPIQKQIPRPPQTPIKKMSNALESLVLGSGVYGVTQKTIEQGYLNTAIKIAEKEYSRPQQPELTLESENDDVESPDGMGDSDESDIESKHDNDENDDEHDENDDTDSMRLLALPSFPSLLAKNVHPDTFFSPQSAAALKQPIQRSKQGSYLHYLLYKILFYSNLFSSLPTTTAANIIDMQNTFEKSIISIFPPTTSNNPSIKLTDGGDVQLQPFPLTILFSKQYEAKDLDNNDLFLLKSDDLGFDLHQQLIKKPSLVTCIPSIKVLHDLDDLFNKFCVTSPIPKNPGDPHFFASLPPNDLNRFNEIFKTLTKFNIGKIDEIPTLHVATLPNPFTDTCGHLAVMFIMYHYINLFKHFCPMDFTRTLPSNTPTTLLPIKSKFQLLTSILRSPSPPADIVTYFTKVMQDSQDAPLSRLNPSVRSSLNLNTSYIHTNSHTFAYLQAFYSLFCNDDFFTVKDIDFAIQYCSHRIVAMKNLMNTIHNITPSVFTKKMPPKDISLTNANISQVIAAFDLYDVNYQQFPILWKNKSFSALVEKSKRLNISTHPLVVNLITPSENPTLQIISIAQSLFALEKDNPKEVEIDFDNFSHDKKSARKKSKKVTAQALTDAAQVTPKQKVIETVRFKSQQEEATQTTPISKKQKRKAKQNSLQQAKEKQPFIEPEEKQTPSKKQKQKTSEKQPIVVVKPHPLQLEEKQSVVVVKPHPLQLEEKQTPSKKQKRKPSEKQPVVVKPHPLQSEEKPKPSEKQSVVIVKLHPPQLEEKQTPSKKQKRKPSEKQPVVIVKPHPLQLEEKQIKENDLKKKSKKRKKSATQQLREND